jgi:hypothetical protein
MKGRRNRGIGWWLKGKEWWLGIASNSGSETPGVVRCGAMKAAAGRRPRFLAKMYEGG